jgi:hypothetical protein
MCISEFWQITVRKILGNIGKRKPKLIPMFVMLIVLLWESFSPTTEFQVQLRRFAMFLTEICLGVLVFLLIYNVLKKRNTKLPPGPWGLPFLGNVLQLGSSPFLAHAEFAKRCRVIFHSIKPTSINELFPFVCCFSFYPNKFTL